MNKNDSPHSDCESLEADVTGVGVKLTEPEERESGTGGARLTNKLKLTDLIAFFEFIRECPSNSGR